MNNYKNTILYLALLATCPAWGQQTKKDSTLNRTVVVENQYNPEVMDAFKVNVLPSIEEPVISKKEISYATTIQQFNNWNPQIMRPISKEITLTPAKRGYLRGAYGNRNNVDLKGAYLWNITNRDQLDVMASLYGHSGNMKVENRDEKWDSRFFRTDASLNYIHNFKNVDFKIGGEFASQVFNYMRGINTPDINTNQHFYTGGARIDVTSNNEDSRFMYGIGTGLDIFQRKHAYNVMTTGSEDKLHTTAFFAGKIKESQRVGIKFSMDNVMYNTNNHDLTLLKFNPYYQLSNENIRLNAGLNIDIQTSYGSRFRISPDVNFDFTFAESYMITAKLTGHTQLNDYHQLNTLSPYWINETDLNTTYIPFDASLSLQGAPTGGIKFNIFGGYRIIKDELFANTKIEKDDIAFTGFEQKDANAAYVGATLDLGFSDFLDFHLGGEYFAWDVEKDMQWILAYKPQFTIDFSAEAKIIEHLSLGLNYNYEGRKEILGERANAVNDLSVKANYRILKNFDVFATVNNILNKTYYTTTGCPSQGFYVMGGVSFQF